MDLTLPHTRRPRELRSGEPQSPATDERAEPQAPAAEPELSVVRSRRRFDDIF